MNCFNYNMTCRLILPCFCVVLHLWITYLYYLLTVLYFKSGSIIRIIKNK